MNNLSQEIESAYSFLIKNITTCKDGFMLDTSEGLMLLKPTRMLLGKIMFIHEAKEYLCNKGFSSLDRYMCTAEGNPFHTCNGLTYTLSKIPPGRECSFDNRDDLISAARLLGSFHNKSKGFIPSEMNNAVDELGKLPAFLSKRLEEIKKLKKIACKGRTKFDCLFLDNVDNYIAAGEGVLESLGASRYNEMVNDCRKEKSLCHHDFTYQNLIVSDNVMSLMNFEYCCYELKVYDLANFIRRKMRKCFWDIREAKVILDEYRTIEPLSNDDMVILRLMLIFPQKFWRVANKYYNSNRSWSEKSYIQRLYEVIDEAPYHENFMKQFEVLNK
jgi:spore coat protein I